MISGVCSTITEREREKMANTVFSSVFLTTLPTRLFNMGVARYPREWTNRFAIVRVELSRPLIRWGRWGRKRPDSGSFSVLSILPTKMYRSGLRNVHQPDLQIACRRAEFCVSLERSLSVAPAKLRMLESSLRPVKSRSVDFIT